MCRSHLHHGRESCSGLLKTVINMQQISFKRENTFWKMCNKKKDGLIYWKMSSLLNNYPRYLVGCHQGLPRGGAGGQPPSPNMSLQEVSMLLMRLACHLWALVSRLESSFMQSNPPNSHILNIKRTSKREHLWPTSYQTASHIHILTGSRNIWQSHQDLRHGHIFWPSYMHINHCQQQF